MKLACIGGLFVPVLVLAQTVGVPQSGFIFDADSHGIRSIDGVPGSATLGPALPNALDISAAAVCSQQRFALIASGERSDVSVFRLAGTAVRTIPAGVLSAPDQIVLTTSCSAGLLYSSATNQLQIITGLPDRPVVAADFSIPLTAVSSFALSDDGLTILCVVPTAGVYVLSPSTPPLMVIPLTGNAGVTFQNKSDALIADTEANRILLVANVLNAQAPQMLAGFAQGISAPAAIAWDAEQQLVLIGNAGTSQAGLLNLTDGQLRFVDCNCAGAFSPLGNHVYEVAAPANELPLLVLDAATIPYKVLFVPTRL